MRDSSKEPGFARFFVLRGISIDLIRGEFLLGEVGS
jgi:hypothetical protein